jgi:hypothetical protein
VEKFLARLFDRFFSRVIHMLSELTTYAATIQNYPYIFDLPHIALLLLPSEVRATRSNRLIV